MSAPYKNKWRGLIESLVLLACLLPLSVYGGQQLAGAPAQLGEWALAIVGVALIAGAWTARYIPTAVDAQILGGASAKLFIGLSSGTFATVGLAQQYPKLTTLDLIFPAYLLAAIGTPVMVYAVSIASDSETYTSLIGWLKRRLGIGG